MRTASAIVLIALSILLTVPSVNGEAPKFSVELKEQFDSLKFQQPLDLKFCSAWKDWIFVVERAGTIRRISRKFPYKVKLYLDLQEQIGARGPEQGLLGLAFHPRCNENGFLYLYYTDIKDGTVIISRFKGNADRVDINSQVVLLRIPQPYANHNGGGLVFSTDGYLFAGVGDGGSGGDPHGNGQNLDTLLGKLLRIDVDKFEHGKNYGVPKDNPYVDRKNANPLIYAFGLRNPWRFSFDAKNNALWLADVGQNQFEEINVVKSGGNYGWNIMEGRHCFRPTKDCKQTGLELPVHEYTHADGISITGGYVYRGESIPILNGWYVYGDFGSGKIWAFRKTHEGQTENILLLEAKHNISSFGVDHENELYLLSYFDGGIYRFSPGS